MINKVIIILFKDKDGFFLFVEGSKIDWVVYVNDLIGMISDVLVFDEVVGKVVEFVEKDGNMMVIVIVDYGNSGFLIGNVNIIKGYDIIFVFVYIDLLKKVKMMLEGVMFKLKEDLLNKEEVVVLYGLLNLILEEKVQLIKVRDKKEISVVLLKLLVN